MTLVVRVRPDVPAVDREFDYSVSEAIAPQVRVGTIVRVQLQGRRVRGWVTALDVEPAAGELREILKVSSAGPPADVMELCAWVAWRYSGSFVHLLRAASPPNNVSSAAHGSIEQSGERLGVPVAMRPLTRELLAWPPAADRREVIAGHIAPEGSTIIVTPAPARVMPLVRSLRGLGRQVVVLHGSDAERAAAWQAAIDGNTVVIGGRAAVFAPVPDLAAVVVLDEHDEALKEERVPAWNAREVAAARAARAGASITLMTPVPTPEGEAIAGPVVRPDRVVERDGWPVIDVVDLRDGPPRGLLTEPLAAALHRTLDAGSRVVCIVNRKGRAKLLACAQCNELARCESCAAAVIDDGEELVCPRCETRRPRVCAQCSSTKLKVLRAGVTKLLEDLQALLPRRIVADIDAASDQVPLADVYIGTEAALYRVPRGAPVRLVAFLDFDQELLAPRVRATQQALALLARAARLVGPRAAGGRLLAQTHVPDHPALLAVVHADPVPVLDGERARLRALGYPPFGGLAECSGDEGAVRALISGAQAHGARTLGPIMNGARAAALILAGDSDTLADVLAKAVPDAKAIGRLRVEVDPLRV